MRVWSLLDETFVAAWFPSEEGCLLSQCSSSFIWLTPARGAI